MARTITALFDTKADADAGAERLRLAGLDAGSVSVHDKSTHRTAGDYSTRDDRGLWGSLKSAFVPDEDRHTYEEGIRRGGFLLTADVDDDQTASAVRALEEANTIDLDARSEQWRSDGWDYAPAAGDTTELGDRDDLTFGTRDPDLGGGRYRSYAPVPRRD